MARLISDKEILNEYLHGNIFNHFLAPKLFLDSPYMVTPKILQCSDSIYLLYREQETGNIDLLNLNHLIIMPHNPYFLVGNKVKNKKVQNNILEAIKEILNRDEKENLLEIDNKLPFNLYKILMEGLKNYKIKYNEDYGSRIEKKKFNIYLIETKNVIEKFTRLRINAQCYAMKLISNMEEGDEEILKDTVRKVKDSRFDLLNELMKKNNLETVLMNSKLNIQELTGKNFDESSKVSALYRLDDDKVYIISDEEIDGTKYIKKIENIGFFESLEYLKINRKNIGFEDHLLTVHDHNEFLRNNYQLTPATIIYRKWREYRAGEDIAFYIIAGKASNYAMERVFEEAINCINKDNYQSEKWLFSKYKNYFNEFKQNNNLPYHFKEYFTNFYFSDRTLYPSIPSNHVINANTNQIKIDAGILMTDKNNLILGTTDIGRVLPLSDVSRQPYEKIKKLIKDTIIPGIKNAKSFNDIYFQGLKSFSIECEFILKKSGLCPDSFQIDKQYDRDIGHLMGKQESFDEKIYKDNNNILVPGIVGCVEIQWQYKNHALVYEDMWYFGRNGVVNFTG